MDRNTVQNQSDTTLIRRTSGQYLVTFTKISVKTEYSYNKSNEKD